MKIPDLVRSASCIQLGVMLAKKLPDVARWIEVRDYLRSGKGELFGVEEEPDLAFVLRDPETGFLMVVGAPSVESIRAAAANLLPESNLIAAPEHGDHVARALPDWTRTRAILHLLPDPGRLPKASSDVRIVDPSTLREQPLIPADLLRELEATESAIAATFVDGDPVAFCYAASTTESLWDISIDTLAEHRRRGHAASCVAYMIRHQLAAGRSPVWAALEENPASWRLAHKLGFEPVDELAYFEPRRT